MYAFLLGFLGIAVAAAEAVLVLDSNTRTPFLSDNHGLWVFISLTLWPTLGAFLGASVIEWWRPRRLFVPLAGRWKPRSLRGAMGGFLAVALYLGAIPFGEPYVRPELILCVTGILGAGIVLLPGARARAGTCRRCGYDLRASMSQERCPECGEGIHAVVA